MDQLYSLEASLRKFSCMTVGDTICLNYNDRNYFLDVREVKPAEASCIIETDCEVDFEPPPGYVEPGKPKATTSAQYGRRVCQCLLESYLVAD